MNTPIERPLMAPEREAALSAMRAMGWSVSSEKRGKTTVWVFKRPDTGGLWDRVECRQPDLGLNFVSESAMSYGDAPGLIATINGAKHDWFRARFPDIKFWS